MIAGEYNGVKGPATTFSPVHLYNLKPKKGTSLTLKFPENYTTAILMIEGQAKVNKSDTVPADNFALFKNDGEEILVEAEDDSVILLMSGEPLDEPIASYGPFLMNTQEEIVRTIEDFQSGKFGYLEG